MSLRMIDLNLVPVLQLLLRERSVSRAAQGLGLSQPAVSAALRRIRAELDDPLLVRIGGRMELTPRAIELIGPLETACNDLESLFMRPRFDPATAQRTFVVATPDHATFLLAPRLLQVMEQDAPGVRLRFVDIGDRLLDQLATRDVDFAIMPTFFLEDLPSAPLHFRTLFRDHSVALFREGHALAQHERVSADHLLAHRMISLHPGSDFIEHKRTLALLGKQPFDVMAHVPQITVLPFLLLDSDYFAIISQKLAERMIERLPLKLRALDFATEPIDIGIAWSQVQDADPAHRWFREMILSIKPW